MYWFLNCLPLIIELSKEIYVLYTVPIRYNAMENNLMWLWILIVRQIYLLIINIIFINRKKIIFPVGILCMLGVITISVGMMLVFHKIQYGEFIGDVPSGIYGLLLGVPTVIVIIAMSFYYFIKVKSS